MKKYKLLTIAPVLTLMAVGCSSPIAMQSSEYDDMYYSSSDKTEYVEPQATAYQRYNQNTTEEALAEGEVLNPEYSSRSARTDNYYSDEYYDGREYDARSNWYRPNYTFVDPFWGAAYTPRMASYAMYDPFFDPFFDDPFYYNSFRRNPYMGWNRGMNLSMRYGMGWGGGFGGFYNHPLYSNWWPNSYGYGFYNGFRPGFHNGMFNNGFYGNPYYGGGFYDRPIVISNPVRVQNSPRHSRGAVVTDNAASGRPARGGVNQGESVGRQTVGKDVVGRPARSGEASASPARTETNVRVEEGKATLPARPSRARREPAVNQQEQRIISPSQSTERRSRQPQQQERRTRTYESTPPRTYESSPARTYESRPSRSYESSPMPRSSGGSSSGSSGGGRPPRGGN